MGNYHIRCLLGSKYFHTFFVRLLFFISQFCFLINVYCTRYVQEHLCPRTDLQRVM